MREDWQWFRHIIRAPVMSNLRSFSESNNECNNTIRIMPRASYMTIECLIGGQKINVAVTDPAS